MDNEGEVIRNEFTQKDLTVVDPLRDANGVFYNDQDLLKTNKILVENK